MGDRRVLLVGCVKRKRGRPAPARDLYVSPLWAARRGYAEGIGAPWFVVSAKYGLVAPATPLEPYDLALTALTPPARREWGASVIHELRVRLGDLRGVTVELHAGGPYRRALTPLLLAAGAIVHAPTQHISGVGNQIAWYRKQMPNPPRAPASLPESSLFGPGEAEVAARAALAVTGRVPRRMKSNDEEVDATLDALERSPHLVPASAWPEQLTNIDKCGMYAWWVDERGADELTGGLSARVNPGRIYAGLTGATKWPSGKTGSAMLRSRVGRSHIGGQVRGSTFRLTLAAALLSPLALRPVAPKQLDAASEERLSSWIREHLAVAVHPFSEPDALADLERRVLTELDPPLNLDGMAPTPLRVRLRELRRRITA